MAARWASVTSPQDVASAAATIVSRTCAVQPANRAIPRRVRGCPLSLCIYTPELRRRMPLCRPGTKRCNCWRSPQLAALFGMAVQLPKFSCPTSFSPYSWRVTSFPPSHSDETQDSIACVPLTITNRFVGASGATGSTVMLTEAFAPSFQGWTRITTKVPNAGIPVATGIIRAIRVEPRDGLRTPYWQTLGCQTPSRLANSRCRRIPTQVGGS